MWNIKTIRIFLFLSFVVVIFSVAVIGLPLLDPLLKQYGYRFSDDLKQALSICVVGHVELPAVFTSQRQFVIEDVPEGSQALEAIKRDADGTNEQTVYRHLTIVANRPTPVLIDFTAA